MLVLDRPDDVGAALLRGSLCTRISMRWRMLPPPRTAVVSHARVFDNTQPCPQLRSARFCTGVAARERVHHAPQRCALTVVRYDAEIRPRRTRKAYGRHAHGHATL